MRCLRSCSFVSEERQRFQIKYPGKAVGLKHLKGKGEMKLSGKDNTST